MKHWMTCKVWMALALAVCLLMGCCVSAAAEEADQAKKNPVLQVIENLKTVDWKELPGELKERISEIDWQALQKQLEEFDWLGALKSIKSFFTEQEWGDVGQEIERLFQKMVQEGAQGFASIKEYLSGLSLDDFVQTLESSANQAIRQARSWAEQAGSAVSDWAEGIGSEVSTWAEQAGSAASEWAEQAGSAVTDVVENVEEAVGSFLQQLGIF